MKLPIAIATLFLATSTSLPAFAAMPSISLRGAAATPIETVQYRQTPRQIHRYNEGAQRSTNTGSHDVIPGWPCIHRSRQSSGWDSAFPSWEEEC